MIVIKIKQEDEQEEVKKESAWLKEINPEAQNMIMKR